MAIVTQIKPQQNKNRVSIFLDGEFYCGLQLESLKLFKICEGKQMSKGELDTVILDSERRRALTKAMDYLSKKMRTALEIKNYLIKKGFDNDAVDAALKRLKELDFVNDSRYAQEYVRQTQARAGVLLINQKLKRLGIDEKPDIDSQAQAATALAQKYMRGKEFVFENRIKLSRYLAGRGFLYDDISAAVDSVFCAKDD